MRNENGDSVPIHRRPVGYRAIQARRKQMIGIETKILPATNTKPRRVQAFTCNGHKLVMPYDNSESDVQAHFKVARRLIEQKLSHPLDYTTMAYGGTRMGYFFCWTQSTISEKNHVDQS
jgi:hypothetical protein